MEPVHVNKWSLPDFAGLLWQRWCCTRQQNLGFWVCLLVVSLSTGPVIRISGKASVQALSTGCGEHATGWEQLGRTAGLVPHSREAAGWALQFSGFFSQAYQKVGTRYYTQQWVELWSNCPVLAEQQDRTQYLHGSLGTWVRQECTEYRGQARPLVFALQMVKATVCAPCSSGTVSWLLGGLHSSPCALVRFHSLVGSKLCSAVSEATS